MKENVDRSMSGHLFQDTIIDFKHFFTYNKDRKFAKLPQTCSEKWPQIRMIVSHLQHQNIIHFLAWMNSKLHYKKLKRQQFNNSWNTPLQSGVEQREVPQSDGLSAKIHKHKVVAPLSMDSAKVPREPFSAVLGMDLAQSLHPCYLSRYPKTLMTYLSRNPFFFYDTAFCLEKYISAHRDGRMMLLLLSIALEAKNLFEIQFQDLLLQPLSFLYPDTISFSDFESFFFLYCEAIVNKGVLQFDRLCMAYICG